MTKQEAIESLRENYCCNRSVCELHSVDLCQKEKCEIWMAISALQAQEAKTQHSVKDTNVPCKDTINRQDALDAIGKCTDIYVNNLPTMVDKAEAYKALNEVPSAQPTLYGYDIKHLMIIAEVLRKENLPPERVTEALTDIGRIVSIVRDEFEESLRKAVEQCKI